MKDESQKRIARVFPRRTKATPDDALAFVGQPPLFPVDCDEVHISVAFTYDLREAERLEKPWGKVAPTKIGGPATGEPEGEFVPGRYLKLGHTITSRGCPNRCWFCRVWRRQPEVVELPIRDGWLVHDDNLLACSRAHIEAVFAMLTRQSHGVQFPGGLEAARLAQWQADVLYSLNPKQAFFAYDTPDDLEPLREAGRMLRATGFAMRDNRLRCYVLVGYPKDTFEAAEMRCRQAWDAGFLPFAMAYQDSKGGLDLTWRRFQRTWCRPAAFKTLMREPSALKRPLFNERSGT